MVIRRYRNGAEAKIKPAISKNLLLPKASESEVAGRLTKIPGTVEAATSRPLQASGVPRLFEKGFKTEPLLDIVELRIINPPIKHRLKKTSLAAFLVGEFIHEPA
jgi:hypothetical protein